MSILLIIKDNFLRLNFVRLPCPRTCPSTGPGRARQSARPTGMAGKSTAQGGEDGVAEGWQVAGLAGGDDISVHHHLGVLKVGPRMD